MRAVSWVNSQIMTPPGFFLAYLVGIFSHNSTRISQIGIGKFSDNLNVFLKNGIMKANFSGCHAESKEGEIDVNAASRQKTVLGASVPLSTEGIFCLKTELGRREV